MSSLLLFKELPASLWCWYFIQCIPLFAFNYVLNGLINLFLKDDVMLQKL